MGDLDQINSSSTNWFSVGLAIIPVLLIAFMFSSTVWQVGQISLENDDYSHGILLPFLVFALMYKKREKLLRAWQHAQATPPSFSFLGLGMLLLGLVLFIFGSVSGNILFFNWCALFPSLLGVLFLVLGTKAAWIITPPILILFMARPIPESLVPLLFNPLQVFAAKVSAIVLEWFDVPVYLMGNIIDIPGMRLLVEEACSGMRSVMALLTVAVIVAYMLSLRFWGFCLLSIVSVVIAVFFNVLRVALTGVLAHFVDAKLATGFFHEFTGLVVFMAGLFILYSLTFWCLKISGHNSTQKER